MSYVVTVDVRFEVDASSEYEAWEICRQKEKELSKVLGDVADDCVAADVWECPED